MTRYPAENAGFDKHAVILDFVHLVALFKVSVALYDLRSTNIYFVVGQLNPARRK